jgi:hypothetical protein
VDQSKSYKWTNQKTTCGHATSPVSVADAATSPANVANAANAVTAPANGIPKQFYDDQFFIIDLSTSMTNF